MVISIILGLALLLELATAALCLRMYVRYGRCGAWMLILLNCALWLGRTVVTLHHVAGERHDVSAAFDVPQLLLSIGSALFLLAGLSLMDGVYRAKACAEDTLRREKRQLAMLVDQRVSDLEAEIAERRRAEEALRRDGERFEAIISTQQEIATADLDLQAVMDLVVTRAQTLTGADGAALRMVDDDAMVFRAASGRAGPNVGRRVPFTDGLAGECIRSGHSLLCNDAETDPRVTQEIGRRHGTLSTIAVPLHHDRQIIGALQVMSPERHAFCAADVHTLQLMTGLIAAAMSHAAEFEAKQTLLTEALERAERDTLTGLLNHRAFHKRFEQAAEAAQAQGNSLAVAVMDLDNFKFFNDVYGHVTGDDVLRQAAAVLQAMCRPGDVLARFGGDEFALLSPQAPQEALEPLSERLKNVLADVAYQPPGHDVAIPLSFSLGVAVFPDEGATRSEAVELADTRLRRAKSGGGDNDHVERLRASLVGTIAGYSMLDALVTAVDNKDRYTHRHCEDVLVYSLEIAREIGLDEPTQDTVAVAALLHDVGKIGVPDHILRKPGRLTTEEAEVVKQHPEMGAVIVSAVPGFEQTLEAVRHHHERWDGMGYPYGLSREEIPFLARLMAVADAFSAMTTDRPYRKGIEPSQAMDVLRQGAGVQWDPALVEAFLHTHGRRPVALALIGDESWEDALPLAASLAA